jgi:hypothetical protein
MARVGMHLSDLFFNHDLSNAYVEGAKDDGGDYDDEKLKEEAETFLGFLRGMGVTDLPSAEELVEDFRARL